MNEYEAGIRFNNDVFVRFKYITDGEVIEVTVIDSEGKKEGSIILNDEAGE